MQLMLEEQVSSVDYCGLSDACWVLHFLSNRARIRSHRSSSRRGTGKTVLQSPSLCWCKQWQRLVQC